MYRFFPPLIHGAARVLILGTFPSPISRERSEYYANPQNKFWNIVFDIFGEPFDNPDYDYKKRVLFDNGLALWDVIQSCEITGALDSAIKNPVYNTELPNFIESKGITLVLFNGANAYGFYRRGIGDVPKNILPSTSPANARMNYDEKLAAWAGRLCGKCKMEN